MTTSTAEGSRPRPKIIKYISLMQAIGIVCVVTVHSFHEYPGTPFIVRFFHSNDMPLFMFVSGFLMAYTSFLTGRPVPSFRHFTSGKLKRLMLPFFVLTMVTFLPRASLSYMADDPVPINAENFVKAFIYKDSLTIPFLWFLQAVFILLLIGFCYVYAMRKVKVRPGIYNTLLIVAFTLLSLIDIPGRNIFSINEVCNVGLFFVLGVAYAHYADILDKVIRWGSPVVFAGCGIIWVILFNASDGQGALYTLCSVFGIMTTKSLSQWLVERNLTFLDHLSGANYIIFLLSWYFNIAAQQVLGHFVGLPWWVHTFLSLFLGIYAPWWIYYEMQLHKDKRWVRVCATLLGQRLK